MFNHLLYVILSTQYLLALEVIFSVSFYRRTVLQIDPKGERVLFNSNQL